jgi:hypothetical protein
MNQAHSLIHLEQVNISKRHHMPIASNNNDTVFIDKASMAISCTGFLTDKSSLFLIKYDFGQFFVKIIRILLLLPDGTKRVNYSFGSWRVGPFLVVRDRGFVNF